MHWDVFTVYQRRVRAELRAGLTRLPDPGEIGSLAWISSLEVGPRRARYLPRGPAEVVGEVFPGSESG